MKKLGRLILVCVFSAGLVACTPQKQSQTNSSTVTKVSNVPVKHQDVRLAFNNITLGTVDSNFTGGTNLEQLKAMFGDPAQTFQTPAGDVTLDGYTWQFDSVTVTVYLLHDSAISRSISNFNFIRYNTITPDKIAKITDNMTFQQAIDLLGQPDTYSESSSSEHVKLQAIWISGIKGTDNKTTPQITLDFINNQLTHKSIVGIK
ncbi:DUF3862 domain-containing protein [Streptococcus sciuri]|uniref:DUF3862 domain-containing protein n=1 Tax=Streptococcus sciuri TaxID=2973939 RepID=A0ABT2F4R7_9STRE|nr:DUF3862 domain-containing protein [Streptococcus sciuri]MCS4487471.1 DUF3862 domain-containing protein [Streptococcus sciuri]